MSRDWQQFASEQCFRYLSYKNSGRVHTLTIDQIENHPQLDRRRFLRNLKNGLSDKDFFEIEHYLATELEYLNTELSKQEWLCGSKYTLADMLFWDPEEPFFSRELQPKLNAQYFKCEI